MTAEPATRIVKADEKAAAEAARCLAKGGLVAFPTETVYGLGADATDGLAIARLFEAKGRPSFNPLIAHVGDRTAAHVLARFDDAAERLAAAFWPGPLTLVLPKAPDCPVAELATAGLDTIAVRVPAHPVARAILAAFGKPVVAPSANRSGHVSPTCTAHVLADLRGRIELIVDGGPTPVGVESTIVACLGAPTLLRRAKLRLNAETVEPGEALLAFGTELPPGAAGAQVINLSQRGDLVEAAANLFAHLRALDAGGAKTIAVMRLPHTGLGEAINDRLRRAAAPRPQHQP
jgi:L-threonylcarbamoyladenylate synthase